MPQCRPIGRPPTERRREGECHGYTEREHSGGSNWSGCDEVNENTLADRDTEESFYMTINYRRRKHRGCVLAALLANCRGPRRGGGGVKPDEVIMNEAMVASQQPGDLGDN